MRKRSSSPLSSPVLIGAVTTLVIVVAVFLAYNANKGLPFIPTFQLKVDTPDAARLVVGNDVREGGFRIGQVESIDPVKTSDGKPAAELTLRLNKVAAPVPADSTILIRPRSALGLKYVELIRGKSGTELPDGAVITASHGVVPPELDDFFSIFDPKTRDNVDRNLAYFAEAFAGRGQAINRSLAALPKLLGDLPPVADNLIAPDTHLVRAIDETENAARITAPLSSTLARGFTGAANTFAGLSADPQALRDTIARSPGTLAEGTRSLPVTRPFLHALADISPEVRANARELRISLPSLNTALAAGTRFLPRTPKFDKDLEITLRALKDLAKAPLTNVTLKGLTDTMDALNPTLKYLGPHITVCNYFNYFFTFLSDHLSEEDDTGTLQRIQVKTAPLLQPNSMGTFGAALPANGGSIDPVEQAAFGDAAALHAQGYPRAVDPSGNADCESGQRGYPDRLATGFPANEHIAVDSRTPGDQGPTFKGSAHVPAGETFSAEPDGTAPAVTP